VSRILRAALSAPGRLADWATDPSVPGWKPALAGLGLIAVIGGIITLVLVLTHADLSCPAGQQLTIASYVPVTVKKVTTMIPVYACTGGG